jgi:diaminopimelate decarboxylase
VHLSDLEQAVEYAKDKRLIFDCVHVHIGSGGDPAVWQANIDNELTIVERHFPDAQIVSFGGGLKEARMLDEKPADIEELGNYAKERINEFYQKTKRKLKMEIEPGTYVIALAGFVVTKVIDKKKTGDYGFNFLVLDGGMEANTRPLLYGARHPFYVVSEAGALLSSEFAENPNSVYEAVLAGSCCESGDSQCLDDSGRVVPRKMAEPEIGDFIAIGGAGAYCSAMTLINYNSHVQAPELLYTCDRNLKVIRSKQTLQQFLANEV